MLFSYDYVEQNEKSSSNISSVYICVEFMLNACVIIIIIRLSRSSVTRAVAHYNNKISSYSRFSSYHKIWERKNMLQEKKTNSKFLHLTTTF